MQTLYIHGGSLVLPDSLVADGAVLCRDGRIEAMGPAAELPAPDDATQLHAQGGLIAPGFVDIHVHGALGCDFMDGTTEAVETAIHGHTRHGTTSILPTTTTGTPEQIRAMLDACETVRDRWQPGRQARLAGVHFYGPYFASEKVGAHPRGFERDPDPSEYAAAFARGIVRSATCAAELPGAEAFYRAAAAAGCLVTCGHSNASWGEMQAGFAVGLRHVDHFWCAMSEVSSVRERLGEPMQGSMLEYVLYEREMSTEVIADGEHLAPELLEFALRFKGVERLCLVTDANRALGMPEGEYKIGPATTGEPFISNGKVGLCPGGGLASSIVGMDHMVRHMHAVTSASVADAIRMASLTPATLVGLADHVGSLAVGKCADVQILSTSLHTQRVIIGGHVYDPED